MNQKITFNVFEGDALDVMRTLPDGSIDAVITDPPYGTTSCPWDAVIPFAPMWEEIERLIKPGSPIVLFAAQPFAAALIMSNPKRFKYEWIWNKSHSSGFQYAKFRPMQKHEQILVFGKGRITYNPEIRIGPRKANRSGNKISARPAGAVYSTGLDNLETVENDTYLPTTDLYFDCGRREDSLHETQKPVQLMRYLVRTYSNPGETVLDFTCGSGSTGVACAIEGRNFIGIENKTKNVEISRARILQATGVPADIPRRRSGETDLPLFEAFQ